MTIHTLNCILYLESEEQCTSYPIQEEGDPPTTVTPSHQFGSGNNQTREADNVCIVCIWVYVVTYINSWPYIANVSKSIEIITEPKDQTIQFKDNEATVKLNCYAELNGNTLCYEWYYDDSDEIISKNSYAELKLNRPPTNIEKRCYCKISIVNQPEHCVKSRIAVIKLEIG